MAISPVLINLILNILNKNLISELNTFLIELVNYCLTRRFKFIIALCIIYHTIALVQSFYLVDTF